MAMTGGGTKGCALVVGECLVDLAPGEGSGTTAPLPGPSTRAMVARPGGSPANVAVGLSRLGWPTRFAGRFSNSSFGPWLRDHLTANDVDLTLSVTSDELPTLALVTLDGDGRASYGFYGPGTSDWQWQPEELPPPRELAAPELGITVLHTGSLAAALPPGAGVLAAWLHEVRRSSDVLVSFDPNVRPGLVDDLDQQRRGLAAMMADAHVLKASHEDVEALEPGRSVESVAQQWLASGPHVVVITEGAEGARLFHRQGHQAVAKPPGVSVVDTIGAGDSFTAGLLASLAAQDLLAPVHLGRASLAQLQEALTYALAASAITCSRAGADPPRLDELEELMHPPPGPAHARLVPKSPG